MIVGWLWYVGTLVPVIGLVHVGIQSIADRYTYIPSIGVFWIVVWGACEVAARWRISVLALRIEAAVVLLGCLLLTWFQVSYWKNSESLFKHAIAAVDENYFGYLHLGKDYYQKATQEGQWARQAAIAGRMREAIDHKNAMKEWRERAAEQFRDSLKINPMYDFGNNNLGVCYADRDDAEGDAKAIYYFKRAVRIKPKYADAHNNLCSVLNREAAATRDPKEKLKRFAEAAEHGEAAIQIRSDQRASDHVNLGLSYEGLKRFSEAEEQYRQAMAYDPHSTAAIGCLVNLLLLQGKFDEAIAWAQQFGAIDPHAKDTPAAIQELRRLLERKKTETFNADEDCQLAAIYEKLGNVPEARKWYQEAIGLFLTKSKDLDASGCYRLAGLYERLGNAAEAKTWYQEGLGRLQEKNLDADGYCQLSMLHEKLGHSAEAKKCLNTALKLLLPAEKGGRIGVDNYCKLAIIYARLGNLAEAEKSITSALKIDPNNAGAQQLMQQLEELRRAPPP